MELRDHCAYYNPVGSSPEKFFESFIESYEKWGEFGFFKDRLDPRKCPDSPVEVLYSGGNRKGVKQDAYAVVTVVPYGTRMNFSRGKTKDIGSVTVATPDSRDLKLALTDLQRITGIKLKRV